jgi:hypothetical protein
MPQVVECLPSICEALSLNPVLQKKKKKKEKNETKQQTFKIKKICEIGCNKNIILFLYSFSYL